MPPFIEIRPSTVTESTSEVKGKKVFDWNEVYHCVSTNQIKTLHRSKQIQETYNKWMKETLTKYSSIENYLLKNMLKFPGDTVSDTKRPPVIILPNDFPYSVASDIQHILIQSQIPLSREYIEEILEKKYGSRSYEWVFWVNPPEIQSVRKIPHCHIFIRPKP